MDLVPICKGRLSCFRIKELKEVLTEFGLAKSGRKQVLIDRILVTLSEDKVSGLLPNKGKEDVAKSIDEIYRRMYGSGGSTDFASKSQTVAGSCNVIPKEEVIEDSSQIEKVRCVCGNSLQTESMIQCGDPKCHVWQHINCVIIHEKTMEAVLPPSLDFFYCELCRLSRADPFLLAIAHPLHPQKLSISRVPSEDMIPEQSIETNFQLTRADKDLLMKQEYDVQVWCMLLNDKVPFRMQWPQHANLQVNGSSVQAINRPGSQLLGANGRDDGPIITPCTRDGINKISLTGCDDRIFCLGVRIVKRRTLQQVLNMIPKEAEGEPFSDALARVLRCVGGGPATENADSDSDLEVVSDCVSVNLRCPMSGLRMKVAGRFKPCLHMGCFDLNVFVEMNQRSKKWQCPVCLKNYSLEQIIIDPYFNRISSKLRDCGEDVAEIEVKSDGSWRVKAGGDLIGLQELEMWHSPDGSLHLPTEVESKPDPQVKEENGSEGHPGLKLGIREPDEVEKLSSGNKLTANLGNHIQNIIYMSDSDDEDEPEPDIQNKSAIIILSDSDEEDEPVISTDESSRVQLCAPILPTNEVPDPYQENHVGTGSTSCLDLLNGNNDGDFGIVDNPLDFGGDDPSLQILLPTRPSDMPSQSDLIDQADSDNGHHEEDWISLSLGGGGGLSDRAAEKRVTGGQLPCKRGREADTDMNGSDSFKSSKDKSKRQSLFSLEEAFLLGSRVEI